MKILSVFPEIWSYGKDILSGNVEESFQKNLDQDLKVK